MRMSPLNWSQLRVAPLFDDSGATAIEYALIAGLIALAILGGLLLASGTVTGLYESVANAFT